MQSSDDMARAIMEMYQRRIDTGVLACGAGLQDHSIGGAKKPKRKYTRKAKTVGNEPEASPVSDAEVEGGKKKRRVKKKGGAALDVPIADIGGQTDGGSKCAKKEGGKKPQTAWNKEVMAQKAKHNCSLGEAMKYASAARKAK